MSDLDQPLVTRQRRRDGIFAATTVVIVLVIGVTYFLTRAETERGRSGGPTSSARTGLRACAAGDLLAGQNNTQAAAGTTYLTATLELAPGVEPCTVEGYPLAILLSDGRVAGVETVSDDSLGDARQLTVLPDRSAKVTLGWAISRYCGPVVNDAIRLWVAPDLPVEVPGFGASACNAGEGRPPVRFGPFTYVDPTVDRGTVAGVVTLNGGPGPGTGQFVTAGEVEFVGDPDDYRAPIGRDGSYEIELPAGRYQVTVSTRQWIGNAPFPAGSFDVTGGELNELNITLPVR